MLIAIRSRSLFYLLCNKRKILFNDFRLKVSKRGVKVAKLITKITKYVKENSYVIFRLCKAR